MANQDLNALADHLLTQAPARPHTAIVTLTGVLRPGSDPLMFGLTFGDGRAVKLDTASVKSCIILGSSVGETIARIEVDVSQVAEICDQQEILAVAERNTGWAQISTQLVEKPPKDPLGDTAPADINLSDRSNDQVHAYDGSLVPFALATPRQAALSSSIERR